MKFRASGEEREEPKGELEYIMVVTSVMRNHLGEQNVGRLYIAADNHENIRLIGGVQPRPTLDISNTPLIIGSPSEKPFRKCFASLASFAVKWLLSPSQSTVSFVAFVFFVVQIF